MADLQTEPPPTAVPPTENFNTATAALGLTPQEQALYQRHLTNLYGGGGVDNPDGSRSTLYQMSTEINGRTYNLPTVYDGRILPPNEALQRAQQEGLDKFPSYSNEAEAEARYGKMHDYMERDTGAFLQNRKQPQAVIPSPQGMQFPTTRLGTIGNQ